MTLGYIPVRTPGKVVRKYSKTSASRPWTTRLLEILRDPPEDFDGSNAKLAEYLGLSQRHVIRVLKQLEEQKLISIQRNVRSFRGVVFTDRKIYLVTKEP